MKPPKKKPLTLWAVVCKDGRMIWVEACTPSLPGATSAFKQVKQWDREARLVKLVEEVRK
jgi:hypothetical protein